MKRQALIFSALTLASCASNIAASTPNAQAKFDRACGYANGVLSASAPMLPIAKGLILANWGTDSALAFDSAISVVKTTCGKPLDLTNSAELIQRVYDAGGQIVALIVKSQGAENGR